MSKKSQHVTQHAELSSDPTTPPGGYQTIYAKTDGKFYARNAAGIVTELTNAAISGANTALSNLITTTVNASLLPQFDANIDLGAPGGNAWLNVLTRILLLKGANSGVITIKTQNDAGTWDFILPTAVAVSNGQLLSGNTDGTTAWVAPGAAGENNPLMVQIFS